MWLPLSLHSIRIATHANDQNDHRRKQHTRAPVVRDCHPDRRRTMARTLYMVIEHFKGGDAAPVYRRFRDHGRLAPLGLTYVSSWVDTKLERCYQLMETDDRQLLDDWMAHWSDIVDFEVYPVMTSAEAAATIAARL